MDTRNHVIVALFLSKQAAIEVLETDRPTVTSIGEEAGIVKRPPWRSASVASRSSRGRECDRRSRKGKQGREIEGNEEDGEGRVNQREEERLYYVVAQAVRGAIPDRGALNGLGKGR